MAVQQLVTELIREKLVSSVHDISEGGLAITLLESAFVSEKGFSVEANTDSALRNDAYWFGEAQSRVVVSSANAEAVLKKAAKAGIPVTVLGKVTDGAITVNGEDWGQVSVWKNLYDTAIEKLLAVGR